MNPMQLLTITFSAATLLTVILAESAAENNEKLQKVVDEKRSPVAVGSHEQVESSDDVKIRSVFFFHMSAGTVLLHCFIASLLHCIIFADARSASSGSHFHAKPKPIYKYIDPSEDPKRMSKLKQVRS